MRLQRGDFSGLAVGTATMREMDRRTVEEFGVPGPVLMENAGGAVAETASSMAAGESPVVVLAGAGNNAGDGFVAARWLSNRGRAVRIITAVPPEKYRGEAALNFRIVRNMGLEVTVWEEVRRDNLPAGALLIDALLGTGLKGELREPFGEAIEFVTGRDGPVLSVDVPSGVDGDTGEVLSAAVKAEKTVTFALPKSGLYNGRGPEFAGEVILADIEMPRAVYPEGKRPWAL